MGELFNADRIVEYCQWYKRRKIDHYSVMNEVSPSVAEMSDDSSMQSFLPIADSQQQSVIRAGNNDSASHTGLAGSLAEIGGSSSGSANGHGSGGGGSQGGNSLSSVLPQRSKY